MNLSIDLTYQIQEKPRGIAEAFIIGEEFIGSDSVCLVLGDNLFHGTDLETDLQNLDNLNGGRIFAIRVKDPERFGVVDITNDGSVEGFHEKPQTDSWVNAGYFVFEPQIFDYLDEECVLEQQPLNQLAADGELMAYKHNGFWQPMDTYRETTLLNQMWDEGKAPWKKW